MGEPLQDDVTKTQWEENIKENAIRCVRCWREVKKDEERPSKFGEEITGNSGEGSFS